MRFLAGFLSLLAFANLALSQRSTACSDSGVCATLATSTSNNDVYIQVSAPSSSGWTAVGIGRQMRGALMFVIYPNGNGGVTVSPRLGAGQFEPEHSNTINVEVMSGSGIVNGRMVANIKCSNCRSWDGGSLGTNWIYARNSRQQITSSSTSAQLSQHNDWGMLPAISLTAAQTTSQDPFASFVGGVTSTNTDGSTNSGDDNSTNNGGSNSGGSSNGGSNSDGPGFKVLLAHAIGMLVAFVILFPLGGFIIRVPVNIGPQRVRIHYALQGLAYALALAAFGLIIWYCDYRENHFKRNHQKFGLVPIILLFFQFILGIVHHMLYKSRGAKAPQITRQGHRWLGRATIIIGLATTWTGIDLAEETGKWKAEGKDIKPLIIAFWVLLAVFLASWVAAAVADGVKEYKSKKKAPDSFSSREVDHELEERRQSKEYTRGQGRQRAIDVQQQRGRSDSFGTPEQGRYA